MATSPEDMIAQLKALAISKQTPEQASSVHVESASSKDATKRAALENLRQKKMQQEAEKGAGVTLQQRSEAAKMALPQAGVSGFPGNVMSAITPDFIEEPLAAAPVDFGKAAHRIPQGTLVINLEAEQNRLKRIIGGESDPVSLGFGEEVNYSAPSFQEREQAKIDLDKTTVELEELTTRLAREDQTYNMSTEGREVSALVSDMVGSTIFEPVPGVGPVKAAKTWLEGLMRFTGRMSAEGAINATASGLEYVPEGTSREDQMLTSMLFSGVLRGGLDAISPRVSNFLGKMQNNKFSKAEQDEMLAIVRRDYPDMAQKAEMMNTLFEPIFVRTQLDVNFTEAQINAMPPAMQQRLAVFTYMDAEPTVGQVFRDSNMMDKERLAANTDEGKDIAAFFSDQRAKGEAKILSVTGDRPSSETAGMDLGADVKNTFDSIAGDWENEWHNLYEIAAKSTDPNVKFSLDAMTTAILDNRNQMSRAKGEGSFSALKDVNAMLIGRMNLPSKKVAQIRSSLKAQYGNDVAIEVGLLNELVRTRGGFSNLQMQQQPGGINANEGNDILKIFNAIKDPTGTDKQVIKAIREGLLIDTIDGTGIDAFKSARKSYSDFHQVIKDFPIAEKLGLTVSDKGVPIWSEQDIGNKLLNKTAKIEDFREFMSLLEQPRFQAVAPQIKQGLRDQIFSEIRVGSFKGAYKGGADATERALSPKAFISTLDKLYERGGKERMETLLTQEERSALAVIKRYSELLTEPPNEGFRSKNPSGTAAAVMQTMAGALVFLNKNPMLTGIAGAASALNSTLAEAIFHKKSMQGMEVPKILNRGNMPPPIADQMFTQLAGSPLTSAFARGQTRGEESEKSQRDRLVTEIYKRNNARN